jgi:hypothetical protein
VVVRVAACELGTKRDQLSFCHKAVEATVYYESDGEMCVTMAAGFI